MSVRNFKVVFSRRAGFSVAPLDASGEEAHASLADRVRKHGGLGLTESEARALRARLHAAQTRNRVRRRRRG